MAALAWQTVLLDTNPQRWYGYLRALPVAPHPSVALITLIDELGGRSAILDGPAPDSAAVKRHCWKH